MINPWFKIFARLIATILFAYVNAIRRLHLVLQIKEENDRSLFCCHPVPLLRIYR